jgi:hypothetical protein
MRYVLPVLLSIALFACQQKTEKTAAQNSETPHTPSIPQPVVIVREYYNKAEKLKLPLVWRNSANDEPTNKNTNIYLEENDTALFGKEAYIMRLLGAYPDTSKFFAFLLAYPADDIMPVLVTFNKKGKRISYKMFGYGCGGADCGYYCMGATFIIENTEHFYAHHEGYYIDCDYENDGALDTTTLYYKQVRTDGYITTSGKINIDEEEILEERKLSFDSQENPFSRTE